MREGFRIVVRAMRDIELDAIVYSEYRDCLLLLRIVFGGAGEA